MISVHPPPPLAAVVERYRAHNDALAARLGVRAPERDPSSDLLDQVRCYLDRALSAREHDRRLLALAHAVSRLTEAVDSSRRRAA